MRLRAGSFMALIFFAMHISIYARSFPGDTNPDEGWRYDAESAAPAGATLADDVQPVAVPTPLQVAVGRGEFAEAYADTYSVLANDNSCSAFFGGPVLAIEVLNDFSRLMRKKRLSDHKIGIKQSGQYSTVTNVQNGASFRLFAEVLLNSNGPFFRSVGPANSYLGTIGRFSPRSREARVLMLLHEIAHLVRGENGKWLIPDDGDAFDLSARNSRTVENHCIDQLLALRREKPKTKEQVQIARRQETQTLPEGRQ